MHRAEPPEFVLLGGSFNPVHTGHMALIRHLAALPGTAHLLVIPAGRSPFKPAQALLPAELRLRLVRACTAGIERVAVLDWELRRPPPSVTYDTIAGLREAYPAARLTFALGSDAFAEFARWGRAAELLALAGLLVFPRALDAGGNDAQALPGPEALPPPWREQVRRDGRGDLVDALGRRIVRYEPLHIPPVAASQILRGRDLSQVPDAARAALQAHWDAHPHLSPT